MGDVVEALYQKLGITHLKTSAYHPQMDAKCERVHFSVHNMITNLIGDHHEIWPDLLGTVAFAYNTMVHSATGYSPHELFYSFPLSCPLDVMVAAPSCELATNADQHALQAVECLQAATSFVREMTGKSLQRMKRYYDASVRPQSYEVHEQVLYYDPRKKRGKFAKWHVCWKGPMKVEHRLNDINYILCKTAKSKPFVVHVDHMRKLPQHILSDSERGGNSDTHTHASTDIASDKRQPDTLTDSCGLATTVSRPTDSTRVVSPIEPANSTVQSSTGICAAGAGDATCIIGTGPTCCHPTDISRATGQLLSPKAHPQQAVCPQRQRRTPARYQETCAQRKTRLPSEVSSSPSLMRTLSKLSSADLSDFGSLSCCLLADRYDMYS